MEISKQRQHFVVVTNPRAMRFFYATLMLVLSLLLPTLSPAAVYVAGDLAPVGAPDGALNAADIAILQRFVLGDLTPTHQDMLIGDVAPLGNPDGVLNVADIVVLMRAVQGAVSLQPIVVTDESPVLNSAVTPTNDNPYIVTGTAAPNIQINLYIDNKKQTTITAGADGAFQINATLLDGINQIHVTAFDGVFESSDSNTIRVDYQNTLLREINSTNNNLTIASDTVLTPGSIPTPYTITGTLTIAANATLILQPGVTLKFGVNSQLLVQAGSSLIVQGTTTNRVTFTSSGPKTGSGEWNGIVINSNSTENLIDYADIDYATYGVRFNAGSRGEVKNSTITNNQYGIYAIGDGLSLTSNPVPVVTWNKIYNNTSYNYFSDNYYDAMNIGLDASNNWWGTPVPLDIYQTGISQGDVGYPNAPWLITAPFLDATGTPVPESFLYGPIGSLVTLPSGNYILEIGTRILPGGYLVIQKGTTLQFSPGRGILVDGGRLDIVGSATEPVILTSIAQTGSGEWTGISIEGSTPYVNISNAVIEHANVGIKFDQSGTAGSVSNSIIRNNNQGIYVYGDASPYIGVGNEITANTDYGINVIGLNQSGTNPNPVVRNNRIYDNGTRNISYLPGRNYYTANFADTENTVLDAKGNWWGNITPAVIDLRIYDHNDSTTSPVVDYSGFLDYTGNLVTVAENDLSGVIALNKTLTGANIYDVQSDLHILAGATLTIEAGVQLRFVNASRIIVEGSLVVQGTNGNEVVFSSNMPNPAVGDWGGIQVNSGATVMIDYADIRYATYGVRFNAGSGGQVRNSNIIANDYGVYVNGDGVLANNPIPVVTDNRIYDNGVINNVRYPGRDYYAINFADAENTVLNATGNGWGNISPDVIALRIYDHTDSPTNSPVVDYSSFLDSVGNPVALTGNYLNGTIASTITLTGDTVYDVLGDLHVLAGATLKIEAGAKLRFGDASWNLIVDGNLEINGTDIKNVVFTSNKSSPAVGDWGGIQLNSGATVTIDYVVIEYAQYGVYFNSASGTVSNSLVQFNTSGIYITGTSSPVLTANRVVHNRDYGIQIIGTNADDTNPQPKIMNNDIYGNSLGEIYVANFGSNSTIALVMTGNWWGTDTPIDGLQIIHGGNTPVAGSAFINYTGYVSAPSLTPVFSAFTISDSYITPNADGDKDTTTISASISVLANWILTVTDTTNSVIRSFSGTSTQIDRLWDGKNALGQTVLDGTYQVTIQATDTATSAVISPVSGTVAVYTAAPTAIISSPANTGIVSGIINISGTATTANNAGVTYTVDYASTALPGVWTVIENAPYLVTDTNLATWATNSYRDEVFVPNGTYLIRLTVRDTLSGMVVSNQVTVTVDNLLINNVVRSNDIINPSKNELSIINFDINKSADVIVRIVPETSGRKIYPDQTPEPDAVRTIPMGTLAAGTQMVTWDGRDDAGNIVAEDAYIYVIEARTTSGRFDKFNSYTPASTTANPFEAYIPPNTSDNLNHLEYNPYKNQFIAYPFGLIEGPVRGRFQVRISDNQSQQSYIILPQDNVIWPVGTNIAFWDGRDDNGNIVTNISTITYTVHGPDGEINYIPIKSNYIVTRSSAPDVPGISLKSDPYIINLSYGQVTQLQYSLADDASVTVTVKEPDTGIETILLNNMPQTVGNYTVPWEGQGNDGTWVPSEGHYTFTITATNPATGMSTVRRGNISVFQ